MLNTSIYGACIYIFYTPLLHIIIQVKCLTLYEYASVKVIKKKRKKSDPSLDTLYQIRGVTSRSEVLLAWMGRGIYMNLGLWLRAS